MKSGLAIVCILGVVLAGGLMSSTHAQVTQEWVARYNGPVNGDDKANSLAVDGNGNVYVTGYSTGSGTDYDYVTIKYNSAGAQQWASRYNGPGNGLDEAYSLAVDGNGNVYVTGWSYGSGPLYDYATIKYDTAGQQQWVARYNGLGNSDDDAYSLAVDKNGNVYVTGASASHQSYPYNYDYATIKYDSAGVQQWAARYNGPGDSTDWASSLAVDDSGNVYVTGNSWGGSGTHEDYATIKYDTAGVEQWVARYNGPGNGDDWANSLAVDGDGNVYVTGYSASNPEYPYNYDYATIKYDSAGHQKWVARYNGPGNDDDGAFSLAVDGSGNVYVTGVSVGSGTGVDYATIKYNAAGAQQWVARYNGPGNGYDGAYRLTVDGNGNVYVTGRSTGNGTSYDYATIKYDTAGQQQWEARYNGPGNYDDGATSLAVDGNGKVYVAGGSYGNGTSTDYATIKYSQNQAVDPWTVEVPLEFALKGAAPNPFNPSTVLSYELRVPSQVKLTVWDTAGRIISTLVNGRQPAGTHGATFDGSGLASGIYLAKFQAGEFTATQKLVLLK